MIKERAPDEFGMVLVGAGPDHGPCEGHWVGTNIAPNVRALWDLFNQYGALNRTALDLVGQRMHEWRGFFEYLPYSGRVALLSLPHRDCGEAVARCMLAEGAVSRHLSTNLRTRLVGEVYYVDRDALASWACGRLVAIESFVGSDEADWGGYER